jgi:signal transduction histidine kinase
VEPNSSDVLDALPCGVLSFADDGRIVAANRMLADRLGFPASALIGKHVETLLPVAGRIFYQTHFFPLVRMHGHAQEVFLLFQTAGGEDVGMLCNAVRRSSNGTDRIDCVLLEVRERRKYEDSLLRAKREADDANRQLQEQAVELEMQHQQLQDQAAELEHAQAIAETANRAKSEFLASMSHELRTPLNAIGGYVALMTEGIYGALTPAQEDALDRVVRAQRHLLGLINDVLNLARIEAGRVDYRIEEVPLSDVVDELAAMIEPQVASKGQHYSVAPLQPKLTVRADRDKLVQVLLNLLSNAVKFTQPGGTIAVKCEIEESTVKIIVTDTGRGIPAEKLESIFEPFVQVRAESAKANEGTGLGLAISRNLARGMHGDLWATSTPGAGSSFTLSLPRA